MSAKVDIDGDTFRILDGESELSDRFPRRLQTPAAEDWIIPFPCKMEAFQTLRFWILRVRNQQDRIWNYE